MMSKTTTAMIPTTMPPIWTVEGDLVNVVVFPVDNRYVRRLK